MLDHLLDGPDEGFHTDFLVSEVELADGGQQGLHFRVVHHTENGIVEFGPGVGAATGFAVHGAPPLHVLPEGEAADFEFVEHIFNTFGVGLVEDYHYGFHDRVLSFKF